jgi:HSP20 family protein
MTIRYPVRPISLMEAIEEGWRTLGDGSPIRPAIDIEERDDALVLTAVLPGIRPEDVEITLTGPLLHIRGEFKKEGTVEHERYVLQERRFGSFERRLELPVRVHGEKAEASFENGVLTVRMPKAEEARATRVTITAR